MRPDAHQKVVSQPIAAGRRLAGEASRRRGSRPWSGRRRTRRPERSAMIEISCFYTLSSPWAYLAGPRLQDIVRRHRARLLLKPFDFQDVVPRTGGVPIRTRPRPRRDYHAVELDRWRRHLGMPLNLTPRFYPMENPVPGWNKPAGHMVIAARQAGEDPFPAVACAPAGALGGGARHRRPARARRRRRRERLRRPGTSRGGDDGAGPAGIPRQRRRGRAARRLRVADLRRRGRAVLGTGPARFRRSGA